MNTNFTYDKSTHKYRLNGKEIPHVTELVQYDFSRVDAKTLESARLEGMENHAKVEHFIKGQTPIDSYLLTFERFLNEHQFLYSNLGNLVACEKPLISSGYQFAGRPDLIFENGIVDLKRRIGNPRVHALQLAGYDILSFENKLTSPAKFWGILEIHGDKYRLKNVYNTEARGIFLSQVQKYRINQSLINYLNTV